VELRKNRRLQYTFNDPGVNRIVAQNITADSSHDYFRLILTNNYNIKYFTEHVAFVFPVHEVSQVVSHARIVTVSSSSTKVWPHVVIMSVSPR
jgi:hypothetical protein